MKKWLVIVIILVVGFVGYNYIYQNHRDISAEAAEFEMSADDLHHDFTKNIKSGESKYLNKTIAISGDVTESNSNDFTLNNKIFCQLSTSLKVPIEPNLSVKVKGRVIGYDELLELVKIDQCTITQY